MDNRTNLSPSKLNFYPYAVSVILGLALCLRLLGLDKGIWLDEYSTLRMIFQDSLLRTLLATRWYEHPPLYFLLLKLWSYIGTSEESLRLLSVFLGVGTVALVIAWIKQYSRSGSLIAGLVLATTPIMLRYSQELRHYGLLLFATALVFFFASRLVAEPERASGYVGLALGLTVAVSTHFVGIMLVVPACIFLILTASRKELVRIRTLWAIAFPCLVFLVLFIAYWVSVDQTLKDWWVPYPSLEIIAAIAEYLSGIWMVSQALTESTMPSCAIYADYFFRFLVVVLGVVVTFGGDWRRNSPFIIPALIFWLEIILYSALQTPIFWYSTASVGLVPLIGYVGLQVSTIQQKRVKVASVIGVIVMCTVFATNWIGNGAQKPIENWRGAAQRLKSAWQPDDLVVFYPGYIEGPTRYYFPALPDHSVLAIASNVSPAQLEADPSRKLTGWNTNAESSALFVVVRSDEGVRKSLETYANLLSLLVSRTAKGSNLYTLIVETDKSVLNRANNTELDLLKVSDAILGPPTSRQDSGSLVWLRYDVSQSR